MKMQCFMATKKSACNFHKRLFFYLLVVLWIVAKIYILLGGIIYGLCNLKVVVPNVPYEKQKTKKKLKGNLRKRL